MASLLYEEVNSIYLSGAVAAGTATTTSAVVDMGPGGDWDELEYELLLADCANTAVITITAKENTANSTSSPTPTTVTLAYGATNTTTGVITSGALVITATATNCDNKLVKIAIARHGMSKRYQFVTIGSATANYALHSIVAHQRRARALPAAQSSDVIATAYAVG